MRKNQVPELPNHGACGQLVALTQQHLPRDRELGGTRRYERGEKIWRIVRIACTFLRLVKWS